MKNPSLTACAAIEAALREGLKKHPGDGWRKESVTFHLHKAARHALTAAMIEEGHIPADGEDHIALALTRSAMALTVSESQGGE